MDYKVKYEEWLNNEYFDNDTHEELVKINGDENEIQDRFYQDLKFGTAGLRGKLGAGTNRMNVYTVSRATEGFARMIEEDGEEAKKKGVVIAYDVRHKSPEFAEITARVFAAHGIHVYIYKTIQPTPVLSYSVRALNTYAGVMVTASHNPKVYNGYKAYGTSGSQILDEWADRITANIEKVDDYSKIPMISFEEGFESGIIEWVPDENLGNYKEKVLALTINDEEVDKNLNIIYSPLNGCGSKWVQRILKLRGFTNVHVVKEQEDPDPDFTTVGYPNPEDPKAFKLSEELGHKVGGEILIATDPDSDRVALEVLNKDGEYEFVNGNRIGILLVHYVLSQLSAKKKLPKDGAVIKSIVTGDGVSPICEKYGIKLIEVLTGFKNIAKPANDWDITHEHTFVFGYEESIGFNHGNFVRDKDAVSSSMLVAEMAGFYKKQGKSLLDVLEDIYQEFGYYNENLISIVLEGLDGQALIGRIMEEFRNNPVKEIGDMKLVKLIDYNNGDTGLPKSNVLKYLYDDKSWFAVRPSGTEPKIKLYMYAVADTKEESEAKLEIIKDKATSLIYSVK